MELLPYFAPGSLSPRLSRVLELVRYESNNRYTYLWRVLELAVPGFDPGNQSDQTLTIFSILPSHSFSTFACKLN
jgi:hypothetical protein